jgi:hypothetical protein
MDVKKVADILPRQECTIQLQLDISLLGCDVLLLPLPSILWLGIRLLA